MKTKLCITIVLMAFINVLAFGQDKPIITCRLLPDNQKILITRDVTLVEETLEHYMRDYNNTVNPPLDLQLMFETSMYEDTTQSGYSLVILVGTGRDQFTIPEGGRLLLKTTAGETISLREIAKDQMALPSEIFEEPIKMMPRHASYLGKVSYGKYPITDEQLKNIIDDGVVKMRVETSGAYHEWNFKEKESMRREDTIFAKQYNCFSFLVNLLYNDMQWSLDPRGHIFDEYKPWHQYVGVNGHRYTHIVNR